MTKKQKRIALAKDVLAQLRLEKFRVGHGGGYACPTGMPGTCNVCAAGALAVSCCGVRPMSAGDVVRCLSQFFSVKELATIESAYECNPDMPLSFSLPLSTRAARVKASKKYIKFSSPYDRMAKIMRNIVRNGKFVP